MKFIGIWILNLLKPVAGSQWHWGGSVFGLQFWDGTLRTQEFSSAVLGWYFLSGFFTCSFGMAPSELNTFHPQVFQLRFAMAPFELNIFHPQIFYLQSWDGTF